MSISQVGPCEGITMGDDLWMSHCNFSTEKMRNKGGMEHIEAAIERLRKIIMQYCTNERKLKPFESYNNMDT